MDLPDGEKRTQMAREEADRDIRQAELIVEARTAVFDVRRAEILAQKVLAQRSSAMKLALADLVVQTAKDLRSPEVRPKDRAQAMVALKRVCDRLFGWDRERDIQKMELARTSDRSQAKSYYKHHLEGTTPPPATGAVNLALIDTLPEELAAMAKAKFDPDDDHSGAHVADHWGDRDVGRNPCRDVPSATDCNGHGAGPCVVAPEQPPDATPGRPIPQKEAPKPPPEGQSAKGAPAGHPVWETPRKPSDDVTHPAPLSQTPFGQTPPPDSFDRARAERRKENWEKYREKHR
jgi:hypothetical protein